LVGADEKNLRNQRALLPGVQRDDGVARGHHKAGGDREDPHACEGASRAGGQ
jgi:hypothetical protein